MSAPLHGITVLDLTRLLPGAICTMFLADLGADVLKIEDPILGDYARWTPPMLHGQGAFFLASNRNKRSLILNLKDSEGQAVLHKLAASADVVLEGFRPGVAARLGAAAATLRAINPRLVYCSLSGWGQTGDYAEVSGHDLNYVALSGLLGSMAAPQPLGGQIADVGGAYAAALGIVSALLGRASSGHGAVLDIALSEAAMSFAMYQWVESVSGGTHGGSGSLTGGMAFYQVYISADDQPMAFAPIEPKFFENFCRAVQRPDWLPLHSQPDQQTALKQDIAALFRTKPARVWHDLLAQADCCFTLITPPEHLHTDPHAIQRQMLGLEPNGIPWMRTPITTDALPPRTPAPHYGEHTLPVLNALGYTHADVQRLIERGIVRDGASPP